MSLRNGNIGISVAAVILFGGGFLLRHSDKGLLQFLALVALFAALGTAHLLDARDERRERRDQ
jgi:hypothetical protein